MANNYFSFKQFTIYHDRCAMKVGTDGVLLGSWAPVCGAHNVLDVGTGTGLIALMLAQRNTSCCVDAVELDPSAACQAEENIEASPFSSRVNVIQSDILTYNTTERYDLIVSNPPYFVDSLGCPDDQRHTARHADSKGLNYSSFFACAARLLRSGGEVAVVLPQEVEQSAMIAAHEAGLYLKRCTRVYTKPGKPCRRLLLSFTDAEIIPYIDELYIENEQHHDYTDAYIALTRDFYLKM